MELRKSADIGIEVLFVGVMKPQVNNKNTNKRNEQFGDEGRGNQQTQADE